MLLYHFTSRDLLRGIRQTGLSLGAVHLSATQQANAVWLTTDPGPNGHGLEWGGDFMNERDRREQEFWSGKVPPAGARFPKEGSIRITVELPDNDRDLHEWLPWVRRRVTADWLAHLHPVAGGNLKKAKTWRLYFGVIPATAFVAVDDVGAVAAAPSAAVAAHARG